MRRVDGYLLKHYMATIAYTLVLLVVIWLAPETLFKLVQGIVGGKLTWPQFWQMLGYHIPPVVQQCLPMAMLFGTLFAVRRLSLNLEWSSLLTAGLSPWRLLRPLVVVGLVVAASQWALQEWAIPATSPKLENLYWQTQLKPAKISPFLYVEKDGQQQPKRFFFIGDVRRDGLGQFIVLDYLQGVDQSLHIGRILKAPTGGWNKDKRVWVLTHGQHHQLDANGVYLASAPFAEWIIATPPAVPRLLQYQFYKPMDMSSAQLTELVGLLEGANQTENLPFYRVRLWQKWTPILACLLFGVLGALLGTEPVRSRRQDSLLYGAVLLFAYGVSQPTVTNLGALQVLPPWATVVVPLLLCSGLTALALWLKRVRHAN
jgi:lipopolysaccharide export system permease protein